MQPSPRIPDIYPKEPGCFLLVTCKKYHGIRPPGALLLEYFTSYLEDGLPVDVSGCQGYEVPEVGLLPFHMAELHGLMNGGAPNYILTGIILQVWELTCPTKKRKRKTIDSSTQKCLGKVYVLVLGSFTYNLPNIFSSQEAATWVLLFFERAFLLPCLGPGA